MHGFNSTETINTIIEEGSPAIIDVTTINKIINTGNVHDINVIDENQQTEINKSID